MKDAKRSLERNKEMMDKRKKASSEKAAEFNKIALQTKEAVNKIELQSGTQFLQRTNTRYKFKDQDGTPEESVGKNKSMDLRGRCNTVIKDQSGNFTLNLG